MLSSIRPPKTDAVAAAGPRTVLRRFAAARSGNVVILFAVLCLPLLGFTGAAIDYGMATRLETKLQAATDATALALCQTPGSTTPSALQTQANTMMTGYMGTSVLVETLGITSNPRQITVTARVPYTAFFGKVTGVAGMKPVAVARCATPLPKTFEIALVLDNTGSMNISDGTQTKMQALKTAASNFVDYVYKDTSKFATGTRISIVPFAGAVAVDTGTYQNAAWIDLQAKSKYHWTNVASPAAAGYTNRLSIFKSLKKAYSGWDWAGCFESLPYPLNVQDTAPSLSNPDSYYVPLFAPDEAGDGSPSAYWYTRYTVATFNSYIDDDNNTSSCPAQSGTFLDLESRACKYQSPRGVSPYTGSGTSVPNGPNFGCTTKPLMTLSSDTTKLKTLIGSMGPLGSTNIHEGFMWGWKTLSPVSIFATESPPPSPYASSTVNKIMIVMTDGTNSWPVNDPSQTNPNKSRYFAMGYLRNSVSGTESTPNSRLPAGYQNISDGPSARTALDRLTLEACNNAKSSGISVYTIGFSIQNDPIDQQGLDLLGACASSSSQFFVANDANGLINAFNQIAASIGTLRLTQ